MGANTSLAPFLYAWSRKGERARFKVPRNWGANVTLLASITAGGVGPCLAVEGSTTREVFEAYLERVLAPSLRPGQVVVMDNLSSHKSERVRELIEKRGCELIYLPPYSPDFNPIEEAFAKLKALLRGFEARTREALWWKRSGQGARCGPGPGRSWLLGALRLPCDGSIAMTDALGGEFSEVGNVFSFLP